MFTFARSRTFPPLKSGRSSLHPERWLMLSAGSAPQSDTGFSTNPKSRATTWLGRLVVIPGVKDAEILLAFKELSVEEQGTLMRECRTACRPRCVGRRR